MKPDYFTRAILLYCKLVADRMNYTPLSHRGQRAARLIPRLDARMAVRS